MGTIESNLDLSQEVQNRFSEDYCNILIGYGSGFKKQVSYSGGDIPQKDFLVGVEKPSTFHMKGLMDNLSDYSLLMRLGGVELVKAIQELSPYIYYNTYVKAGNETIKYGIISTDKMISDLLTWETLYTAGRLHKPVEIFRYSEEFGEAYEENLEYALRVALLLLPENFTEQQLYEAITGISYMGDTRKGVFENPKKVSNIVAGDFKGFQELYKSVIKKSNDLIVKNGSDTNKFSQYNPLDRKNKYFEEGYFPKSIMNGIPQGINTIDDLQIFIKQRIGTIVRKTSTQQALKGFISAGLVKSLKYLGEKRKKAKKS